MSDRVVWKYELPDVVNYLTLPVDAVPLHVAEQHGRICMWVQVDPDASTRERTFYVVGTGHRLPPDGWPPVHLGSLLTEGGTFAFHVYESLDQKLNAAKTP